MKPKSKKTKQKETVQDNFELDLSPVKYFADPSGKWDIQRSDNTIKCRYALSIEEKYYVIILIKKDNTIQELIDDYALHGNRRVYEIEEGISVSRGVTNMYDDFILKLKTILKEEKKKYIISEGKEAYSEYCKINNIPPDRNLTLLKKWYEDSVKSQIEEWKKNEQDVHEISKEVVEEDFIILERTRVEACLAGKCKLGQRIIYREYLKFLEDRPKKKNNEPKHFNEYLLHDSSIKLAEALKNEFKTEKGKGLALMLKALEENHSIIHFEYGKKKEIFNCMKTFFKRDIGARQGLTDFKYIDHKHGTEYKATIKRIDQLLRNIKTNKK